MALHYGHRDGTPAQDSPRHLRVYANLGVAGNIRDGLSVRSAAAQSKHNQQRDYLRSVYLLHPVSPWKLSAQREHIGCRQGFRREIVKHALRVSAIRAEPPIFSSQQTANIPSVIVMGSDGPVRAGVWVPLQALQAATPVQFTTLDAVELFDLFRGPVLHTPGSIAFRI